MKSCDLCTDSSRVAGPASRLVQFVPGHLNQLFRILLQQRHRPVVLQLTRGGTAAPPASSLQLGLNGVERLLQDRQHLEMALRGVARHAELQEGDRDKSVGDKSQHPAGKRAAQQRVHLSVELHRSPRRLPQLAGDLLTLQEADRLLGIGWNKQHPDYRPVGSEFVRGRGQTIQWKRCEVFSIFGMSKIKYFEKNI